MRDRRAMSVPLRQAVAHKCAPTEEPFLSTYRTSLRRDVQRSCASRRLGAFDLPGPRMTRRAGGGSALRVAGMDAGQFGVRAGCPVDKPRNPPAHLEGDSPEGASSGGPFSLVTFSWASKRK